MLINDVKYTKGSILVIRNEQFLTFGVVEKIYHNTETKRNQTKYFTIIVSFQSEMLDNMSSIILTQINRIFVNFLLFWHRVSFILFYFIENVAIRCKNAQKERKANVSAIYGGHLQ